MFAPKTDLTAEIMKLMGRLGDPSARVSDKQTRLFTISLLCHTITTNNQQSFRGADVKN